MSSPKKKNVVNYYTFSNESSDIRLRHFKEDIKDEIIEYSLDGSSNMKPYDRRIYVSTFEEYSTIINSSMLDKFIIDPLIFPRQAVRFLKYTDEIAYVVYEDGTDIMVGLRDKNKLFSENGEYIVLCDGDYVDGYIDSSVSPPVIKISEAKILICCNITSKLFKELDDWLKLCSGKSLIDFVSE